MLVRTIKYALKHRYWESLLSPREVPPQTQTEDSKQYTPEKGVPQ